MQEFAEKMGAAPAQASSFIAQALAKEINKRTAGGQAPSAAS